MAAVNTVGSAATAEGEACLVCAEVMDGKSRLAALPPCGHNNVCAICALRLRYFHKDLRCPACNVEAERMAMVQPKSGVTWEQIEDRSRPMAFHRDSSMLIPPHYLHQFIEPLLSFHCGETFVPDVGDGDQGQDGQHVVPVVCNATFKNAKALTRHLREKHDLQMCRLCTESKPAFSSELERYSLAGPELEQHMTVGNQAEGFKGHPRCKWCKQRFYDSNALFQHLNKNHYSCHICEAAGATDAYYQDYDALQHHYRRAHYPCEDPACLARRFVVFKDDLELQAHMVTVHRCRVTVGTQSYGARQGRVTNDVREGARVGSGQPGEDGRGLLQWDERAAEVQARFEEEDRVVAPEDFPTLGREGPGGCVLCFPALPFLCHACHISRTRYMY